MLITPADSAFSLCVRERTNWTCELCGKQYERGSQGFHCSHFFGRGAYWSVRFEPLNCSALCYHCHMHFHENPDHHKSWMEKKLGNLYFEILKEKAYNITLGKEIKRTKGKGEIAKHYREEHERQLAIRASGELGKIDFQGWA